MCTFLRLRDLVALAVGLGGVITLVDDQVEGVVVVAAREVRVKNGLGASSVSLLGINRGTRHVRNHGVTTSPGAVGSSAERVVLGGGLVVPDVTTVTTELARLESLGNVLLDDNGTTGGVDEPRTLGFN